MVPTDYRLDHVAARLIERLEGSRPTWGTDSRAAGEAFRTVALEHADGAMAEYESVALAENPEPHAAFVRRELLHTFLPRYTRVAVEMNRLEEVRFGLGWLGEPPGRVALAALAVLILWVVLVRFVAFPVVWPLVLLDLALPFVPDLVAAAYRTRYRRQLGHILTDLGRIQEQATAYLPAERLRLADPAPPPPQRDHEEP